MPQHHQNNRPINPGSQVIEHNSPAFRQMLQLPRRPRLGDIEETKQTQSHQRMLPIRSSVSHCPATSSMTTFCGSFRPDSRAMIVAAGMPMAVARNARKRLIPMESNAIVLCESGPAATAKSNENGLAKIAIQISVAATDPHVPGPGFRSPAPKNVPAIQAHRVRAPSATSSRSRRRYRGAATPVSPLPDLHRPAHPDRGQAKK
jgi:hypothetical protein